MLRRFKNWVEKRRGRPLLPLTALPVVPPWTTEDRDRLFSFLNSDTGMKLRARWMATEYQLAIANAKDQFHSQHAAGNTVGYGQCYRQTISLSQVAGDTAATSIGARGEALPDETPAGEREYAEFLQRNSP